MSWAQIAAVVLLTLFVVRAVNRGAAGRPAEVVAALIDFTLWLSVLACGGFWK